MQSLTSSHGSASRTEKSQLSNPLLLSSSTPLFGGNVDGGWDDGMGEEENGVLFPRSTSESTSAGAVEGGICIASRHLLQLSGHCVIAG